MTEEKLQAVTSDEKTIVGVSYLFGWIAALLFWMQSKGKSEYVRFHTMQATLFSVALVVVYVFTIVLTMGITVFLSIILVTSIVVLPELEGIQVGVGSIPFLLFTFGSILIPFFLFIPMWILQIINLGAVIQGFSGKDWRYPLLAKWAEKINQRDLGASQRNES